jgi:hypothetical protein
MININLLWYNALDAARKEMEKEWGKILYTSWFGPYYDDNSYAVWIENFNNSEEVHFWVTFEEIDGFPHAILEKGEIRKKF